MHFRLNAILFRIHIFGTAPRRAARRPFDAAIRGCGTEKLISSAQMEIFGMRRREKKKKKEKAAKLHL